MTEGDMILRTWRELLRRRYTPCRRCYDYAAAAAARRHMAAMLRHAADMLMMPLAAKYATMLPY